MYVAGIDAHTTYLMVAVVNKDGVLVQAPLRIWVKQPEKLLALLAPYRPLEAVVETSGGWPWLRDLLVAQGITFVLAHAKKLRAIAEATFKSDAISAELLARMRRAGLIPQVYARPPEQREWAILVRHRTRLVRLKTVYASRIHAELHAVGLRLPRGRLLTRGGRRWVKEEAWPKLSPEQRALVATLFRLLEELRPHLQRLDRRITATSERIPEARLLQTIPGIGPFRALVLCAEVLPITRFATPAHLISYAGLAPRTAKSGLGPIRHGAIPQAVNRWLRGVLVQTVVRHVQDAPQRRLALYYAEHKQKLGWPVARVATARKLARIIFAMLHTGTPWQDLAQAPPAEAATTSGRGEPPQEQVA
jgi:transposase